MNTLRDAHDRRAKPSVWPVYVTAVIIGVLSLMFLGPVSLSSTGPFRLYAVYGLFGIVTVVGVVRFRSWGWWSALVWIAVYTAIVVWGTVLTSRLGAPPGWWAFPVLGLQIGFCVWFLVTRRRLFFLPIGGL